MLQCVKSLQSKRKPGATQQQQRKKENQTPPGDDREVQREAKCNEEEKTSCKAGEKGVDAVEAQPRPSQSKSHGLVPDEHQLQHLKQTKQTAQDTSGREKTQAKRSRSRRSAVRHSVRGQEPNITATQRNKHRTRFAQPNQAKRNLKLRPQLSCKLNASKVKTKSEPRAGTHHPTARHAWRADAANAKERKEQTC